MHMFPPHWGASVNSNVAWHVCLLTCSSVPYVKMLSVKEKYIRMNVDTLLLRLHVVYFCLFEKMLKNELNEDVQTPQSSYLGVLCSCHCSWPLKNQWDWVFLKAWADEIADTFQTFELWLFQLNLKHPSKYFDYRSCKTLYFGFFFSSSCFTTGNIKCQEKCHAIIQIIF